MRKSNTLDFFDISNDLKILPENELFKIKGGNSDIAWENELDPIDIPPPDDNEDDYPEEEYSEETDWYDEEYEAYLEELAEVLREGGTSSSGSNTEEETKKQTFLTNSVLQHYLTNTPLPAPTALLHIRPKIHMLRTNVQSVWDQCSWTLMGSIFQTPQTTTEM
ncbi:MULTISPECIES: hypothetical protein [Sphingobacterium]|uniref:hypothetical protein n=1 Tax=Sphingobacterium TaxID=28453 RepID=UPI0013D8EAA4|nr:MULTISPECIES: hypothetical protein [unclassified Sphingobacterium]